MGGDVRPHQDLRICLIVCRGAVVEELPVGIDCGVRAFAGRRPCVFVAGNRIAAVRESLRTQEFRDALGFHGHDFGHFQDALRVALGHGDARLLVVGRLFGFGGLFGIRLCGLLRAAVVYPFDTGKVEGGGDEFVVDRDSRPCRAGKQRCDQGNEHDQRNLAPALLFGRLYGTSECDAPCGLRVCRRRRQRRIAHGRLDMCRAEVFDARCARLPDFRSALRAKPCVIGQFRSALFAEHRLSHRLRMRVLQPASIICYTFSVKVSP